MNTFLKALRERIVVFDGAMGTNIQSQNLTPDDFGGLDGCNEYLVITKPEAIETVHSGFLEVGCDVVETDSFGSTSIVLAEYNIADQAYDLNFKAAQLAKKVARDYTTPDKPRWVAGSMGPTTKLPSLHRSGVIWKTEQSGSAPFLFCANLPRLNSGSIRPSVHATTAFSLLLVAPGVSYAAPQQSEHCWVIRS